MRQRSRRGRRRAAAGAPSRRPGRPRAGAPAHRACGRARPRRPSWRCWPRPGTSTSATQLRESWIVNWPVGGRWKKLNAAALDDGGGDAQPTAPDDRDDQHGGQVDDAQRGQRRDFLERVDDQRAQRDGGERDQDADPREGGSGASRKPNGDDTAVRVMGRGARAPAPPGALLRCRWLCVADRAVLCEDSAGAVLAASRPCVSPSPHVIFLGGAWAVVTPRDQRVTIP